MTHYIGLDGHSKTSTFVALDERGKLVSRAHVLTTESNILRFIRSIEGNKKVVFEESHLSQWFYSLFENEGVDQVVCDPYYLGKKQGSKDDDKDAFHLANELRCAHITPVYHDQSEWMQMRVLTAAYIDMVREITKTKNRYKALFRSQALPTTGQTIYSKPERIIELKSKADRFVAKQLFSQLERLEKIKAGYLREFKRTRRKQPLLKKLDTVPGFDVVRSYIVASLICSAHRFRNKHKFWAYSMLVKYKEVSDERCYGYKAVRGRRELKGLFDGAAESALKGNSSLRRHYDELILKGIDHRKAKKSVARKIAAICLSIMKHQTNFDDKYEEKKNRNLKQAG